MFQLCVTEDFKLLFNGFDLLALMQIGFSHFWNKTLNTACKNDNRLWGLRCCLCESVICTQWQSVRIRADVWRFGSECEVVTGYIQFWGSCFSCVYFKTPPPSAAHSVFGADTVTLSIQQMVSFLCFEKDVVTESAWETYKFND